MSCSVADVVNSKLSGDAIKIANCKSNGDAGDNARFKLNEKSGNILSGKRNRAIIKDFLETYFSQSLDIRIQSFNMLMFVGILGLAVFSVINAATRRSYNSSIIQLACATLLFILLRVTERKKCYRISSLISVIAVSIIVTPVSFFNCGGYRGGMPGFFILSIIFTSILLEKIDRIVMIVIEFALYIGCCLYDYYNPGVAAILPTEFDYVLDVILGFFFPSILLLFIGQLRDRMARYKQEEIRELHLECTVRNEILEQYDTMKSDFLATVAHEINTPLAVISASSNDTLDLLEESPLNITEIEENQKVIVRRVKLIDSILLDLMDTVAIEKGRLSLSRQPTDLAELIRNMCDSQFKKLDVNNNKIVCELQPNLPKIWVDPPRIEQVMLNLLSNAIRHTTNGIISIKLEQLEQQEQSELPGESGQPDRPRQPDQREQRYQLRQPEQLGQQGQSNNRQVVRVSDNGEGMDAEMTRIVFRQYVSNKEDFWRHGIGMYICRRIIVAHGGDIWADSEKGRGTTITFTLREGPDYE